MARTLGTYSLSANIEMLAGAPLDAREIVPAKADLTTSGMFPYAYIGMETYVVAENKKYRLIGIDPTIPTNWEEINAGSEITPNPSAQATDDLSTIKINNTVYSIVDPTVPSWAKASSKPSYTFSEIGSTPTTLSGYGITDAKIVNGTITLGNNSITPLTSFTETDPTVPAWAKASNKPSYIFSEIGSTPTTLAGYGITDAKIVNGTITLGNNTITPVTDISGKADKNATVSTVAWDSSNNKLTKTINGSTTDVVTASTILSNLIGNQVISALGYTPAADAIGDKDWTIIDHYVIPSQGPDNITLSTYISRLSTAFETAINDHADWISSSFLPLSGGTMAGDITMSNPYSIITRGASNGADIRPATNGKGYIGTSSYRYSKAFINEVNTEDIYANTFFAQNSTSYATIKATNVTEARALEIPNKSGTIALTSDITDTKVTVTNTNPASGTTYYPVWYTATSGTGGVGANNGVKYYTYEGTASALGVGQIILGNNVQSGTAGNKIGSLVLYSEKNGYVDLRATGSSTSGRQIKFPDAAGTVALTSDLSSYLPTTTKYAASSSVGGAATSAAKLTNTAKIGDTNQPVYFTASGVPTAISYTIAKSVPSTAVFTDANVTQTATSDDKSYEVLFSGTNDNTTRTEGARKSNNLTFNPYSNVLTASKLRATRVYNIISDTYNILGGGSTLLNDHDFYDGAATISYLNSNTLPYTPTSVTLTAASGTLNSYFCYRFGRLVILQFQITGAFAAGSAVKIINGAPKPSTTIQFSGYWFGSSSDQAKRFSIDNTGSIYYHWNATASNASGPCVAQLAYYCA